MAYNKTVKLRSMQLLISLTNCCLEAVCIAFYLERTRFYSQKILEEENGTLHLFLLKANGTSLYSQTIVTLLLCLQCESGSAAPVHFF